MEHLILTGRFDFLEFFLRAVFGAESWPSVVTQALYIVGVWKLLEKSGLKGWWALIPCAREYQLSRCALREPEGRVLAVCTFISWIFNVFGTGLYALFRIGMSEETAMITTTILHLPILITAMIYMIRILSGLIEVYDVKKRWMWLWLLPYTDWIPAVVWGFNKKYQPKWKVEDIRAELEKLAFQGSAEVMDEGLTVNLKERSATEFFQKKVLLRDIHMSIPQGHMVLLLGGSGAGKTTFVNAINGYEKADAQILLNGTDMYRNYKKMMYEVGFVPQSEMMRGKDTVSSTLSDTAKFRLSKDIPRQTRKERIAEVEEIFGLKPVENSLVNKLSGGQKKRLSISMEMLSSPSLFILDEPDSGLDGVMARELFEQLRKIADSGKIVIVITHTPDRVIDLFDDVIVLAKDSTRTGRLAFYGSIGQAREFFGKEKMEEIVKTINRKEEGGDGLADEYVMKYAEVHYG